MMNGVCIGCLARVDEVKGKETKFRRFSIVADHYNSQTKTYDPDFMECVVFGKRATDFKYNTGDLLEVTGKLTSRKPKEGQGMFWTLAVDQMNCLKKKDATKKEETPPVISDEDDPYAG